MKFDYGALMTKHHHHHHPTIVVGGISNIQTYFLGFFFLP
jgi:hypothetical protein